MDNETVDGFFYGLYMDSDLLRSIGMNPMDPRVARIDGYRVDLRGVIKIVPSEQQSVWGVVIKLSPEDLGSMYSGPTTRAYRPMSVEVETQTGERLSVQCYNQPVDSTAELNEEYLKKLVVACGKVGLPAAYVQELEMMAPGRSS